MLANQPVAGAGGTRTLRVVSDRLWSRSHLPVPSAQQVTVVTPCLDEGVAVGGVVDLAFEGIRCSGCPSEAIVANSSIGESAPDASVAVQLPGIAR